MLQHDLADILLRAQPGPYRQPAIVREVLRQLRSLGGDVEEMEVASQGRQGGAGASVTLRGWLFRGNSGAASRPLVVLSHGVQAGRLDMVELCLELQRRGFSALCYDGRAHGLSGGDMITYGYHERHDVMALARAAGERCGSERFILGGLSMGGAISLLAAGDPAVAGVATFSAYYDFTACFQRYLELSLPNITAETIDLVLGQTARLAGFEVADVSPCLVVPMHTHRPPLLVQHGGQDILIPMEQARDLAQAWGSTARLIEHPSAGHADILSRPEALKPFYEFVERVGC